MPLDTHFSTPYVTLRQAQDDNPVFSDLSHHINTSIIVSMHMPNRYTNKPSNFEFIKSIVFDTDLLTTGIRINVAAIIFVTLLLFSNYGQKRNEEVNHPVPKSLSQPTTKSSNLSVTRRINQ
jgi:hypothetical protein